MDRGTYGPIDRQRCADASKMVSYPICCFLPIIPFRHCFSANEIGKDVKQCVEFYYLWKKVCSDEYKRLRIIRKKREQADLLCNLRSRTEQVMINLKWFVNTKQLPGFCLHGMFCCKCLSDQSLSFFCYLNSICDLSNDIREMQDEVGMQSLAAPLKVHTDDIEWLYEVKLSWIELTSLVIFDKVIQLWEIWKIRPK